jgi:hypothetical protein
MGGEVGGSVAVRHVDADTPLAAGWGHTAPAPEIFAMSLPVEALEAERLRLPTADRARLRDQVIASLDVDKASDEV